ncbi:LuxR C-terminal-related transcriptional regulator [Streptomyces sp. NPDC088197]|uniref:helix-turn-helix transcriptional regulator n=1 Tax=Streptomyces sp. NPDC088197 TaxID=3365840 RepID=UPI0037F69D83
MGQARGEGRDIESAVVIYTAVANGGGAPYAGLAGLVGLDEGRLESGLRTLKGMGLVRLVEGRVETVDPDAALAVAMDTYLGTAAAQLRNAAELSETTQALLTVFRPAAARLQEQVVVQNFEDLETRLSALADIDATARESVDSLHPGPMPQDMAVLEHSLAGDAAMVRRGVRVRALYPRSLLQIPKYSKYLNDLTDVGVGVRLIDHGPHDLLVVDRHTVVLPGVPHVRSSMTLVRGAVLARSYVSVYEDYWLRAKPMPHMARGGQATPAPDSDDDPAAATDFTDQERTIIRLMANGYSDDRIARTLGVARRTVQRVMTKLMERLQVSSRFEVGLKLARLLDPDDL